MGKSTVSLFLPWCGIRVGNCATELLLQLVTQRRLAIYMVAIYLVPKSEIERDILYTGPNNTVRNDVCNGISEAIVLN